MQWGALVMYDGFFDVSILIGLFGVCELMFHCLRCFVEILFNLWFTAAHSFYRLKCMTFSIPRCRMPIVHCQIQFVVCQLFVTVFFLRCTRKRLSIFVNRMIKKYTSKVGMNFIFSSPTHVVFCKSGILIECFNAPIFARYTTSTCSLHVWPRIF